jgi:hypothetical protein
MRKSFHMSLSLALALLWCLSAEASAQTSRQCEPPTAVASRLTFQKCSKTKVSKTTADLHLLTRS